jgi:hypothetical protein
MKFDELLYDRKAQSKTAMGSRGGSVCLPESFEHMGQKLGRNTDARIRHTDLDVGIHSLQQDLHFSALRTSHPRALGESQVRVCLDMSVNSERRTRWRLS